jgi:hypothetical protein
MAARAVLAVAGDGADAAPLRADAAAVSGSVAVAAITAAALSLFHDLDATVMILLWNVGLTGLYIGLSWVFGGKLFPGRGQGGTFDAA